MKYEIKNRWTDAVIFTAEIKCSEDAATSIKLGLAVKVAVEADANLTDANLTGANLTRANLTDAYLTRAYLAGANLTDANLTDANLTGANLTRANLTRANLTDANLTDANLTGANLTDANLTDAYLTRANLTDAYLTRANLTGAKWRDGVIINRAPLRLHGLAYPVYILDDHMQIGCELHSLAEWAAFDDRRIAGMDGITAARFWKANKVALLALAAADGRGVKKDAE